MVIKGNCIHCGTAFTVDEKFSGQQGQCSGCKQVMTIPYPPQVERLDPLIPTTATSSLYQPLPVSPIPNGSVVDPSSDRSTEVQRNLAVLFLCGGAGFLVLCVAIGLVWMFTSSSPQDLDSDQVSVAEAVDEKKQLSNTYPTNSESHPSNTTTDSSNSTIKSSNTATDASNTTIDSSNTETDSSNPISPRTYLSDMPLVSSKVGWGKLGRNGAMGFEKGQIQVNGKPSPKGIGMHPWGEATFDLTDKEFKTFHTTAAMNDSAGKGPPRKVIFEIVVNNEVVWNSHGMRGAGESVECWLDVSNIKRLTLRTRYYFGGSEGSGSAHAVWLDPYFETTEPPTQSGLPAPPVKLLLRNKVKKQFEKKLKTLLEEGHYDELGEIGDSLVDSTDFLAGLPKMVVYYGSLERPVAREDQTKEIWSKHLSLVESWAAAKPNSIRAQIAHLRTINTYALFRYRTSERTQGPARDQDLQAYEQANEQAWNMYLQLKSKEGLDPSFYSVAMLLENKHGASSERIQELFESGLAINPRYVSLYERLQKTTVWPYNSNPDPQAVDAFADRISNRFTGDLKHEIYARMIWASTSSAQGTLDLHLIPYEKLRPGLLILVTKHPEVGNYVQFAACAACLNFDLELGRTLFSRVGPYYQPFVWHSLANLHAWRRWVSPDLVRGQEIYTHLHTRGFVNRVLFSRDGQKLFVTGASAYIEVLEAKTGKRLQLAPLHDRRNVISDISLHPSKHILAAAFMFPVSDGGIVYFKTDDLQNEVEQYRYDRAGIHTAQFSQDGQFLAAARQDGVVQLWTVDNFQKSGNLQHPGATHRSVFAPNSNWIATATAEGGLYVWELKENKGEFRLLGDTGKTCDIAITKDSSTIVTVSMDRTVRTWDPISGEKRSKKFNTNSGMSCLDLSPDENLLAIGLDGGQILVVDFQTLEKVHVFREHWGRIQDISFSRDGKLLATGAADGTVKVWDATQISQSEADSQ